MAANGIMRWGLELLGGNVAAMLLFHPVAFTLVGTTVYQHYSADGVDPEGSDILLEDAVRTNFFNFELGPYSGTLNQAVYVLSDKYLGEGEAYFPGSAEAEK